ncbi:Uncharacterised protein [Cedecea neteri]|uniref:Uncharacterized protein n=1 Tax=Cedecea neteri TaxID=158822 RepID=A0A2X3ILM1_9ENTR|nr:Uncharacterised protein [Cedecea neteri]
MAGVTPLSVAPGLILLKLAGDRPAPQRGFEASVPAHRGLFLATAEVELVIQQ